MNREAQLLGEYSLAVRDSTIKRLRMVREGFEDWRPTSDSMSIGDIAQHLLDADRWLFAKLKDGNLASMKGEAGKIRLGNYATYLNLIDQLHVIGEERARIIGRLNDERLQSLCYDDRYGKEVTIWWIIVRGNLDHETHHRGQLAAYLRILDSDPLRHK